MVRSVVAVHGVGFPAPGELLPGLEEALRLQATDPERPAVRVLDTRAEDLAGHVFQRSRCKLGEDEILLWDANWSDVAPGPQGWLAKLFFLMKVLLAAVDVAGRGPRLGYPLFLGWAFGLYFCCLFLWVPFLPILRLYSEILPNPFAFGAAAVVLIGLMIGGAWYIRTVDPWAAIAGVAAALGLLGFAVAGRLGAPLEPPVLLQAVFVLLGPALLFFACVEALPKLWATATRRAAVSRLGILILAIALYSGAMAAFFWTNLFLAQRLVDWNLASEPGFAHWSQSYFASLPYDLAFAEFLLATATVVFGIGGAIAFCAWCRRMRRGDDSAGDHFRTALYRLFWLLLGLFIAVSILLTLDIGQRMEWWSWSPADPLRRAGVALHRCLPEFIARWLPAPGTPGAVMWIYAASAARLAPFVLGLTQQYVRVALDVFADVMLYLHQPGVAVNRVRGLVQALAARKDEVSVVGHSQGSLVVADALFGEGGPKKDVPRRVATTGSPIQALHVDFLGLRFGDDADQGQWEWRNFFRGTDFIGGRIGSADDATSIGNLAFSNRRLEDGLEKHHLDYWSDETVLAYLLGLPDTAGRGGAGPG